MHHAERKRGLEKAGDFAIGRDSGTMRSGGGNGNHHGHEPGPRHGHRDLWDMTKRSGWDERNSVGQIQPSNDIA